jgi:hypothetical protein
MTDLADGIPDLKKTGVAFKAAQDGQPAAPKTAAPITGQTQEQRDASPPMMGYTGPKNSPFGH